MANEVELPKCKYGENCYRRNPDHLRQFWHPFSRPESSSVGASSGLSNRPPNGSRAGDQPSSSAPSRQGRDLTPPFEDAGGEWEIDDDDDEVTACSEAEEIVEETPTLSNSDESNTGNRYSTDAFVLLVLVGAPGSGKSTFCSKLMSSAAQPWTRVCQDIIAKGKRGTKQQCLRQAESALLRRRSVVIDRCNIDRKQREDFLKLASRLKINSHAVVLDVPPKVCIERAANRVAHEGGVHGGNAAAIINRLVRTRQLPSLDEGFFRISFCRTDLDIEKTVQEYRDLQPSKLLDTGVCGLMHKSQGRSVLNGGANSTNNNRVSHVSEIREEMVGVGAETGKQQGSDDSNSREVRIGNSGNLISGEATLAFPSISTADFKFDHEKAATVLVESVSEFQLKYPISGLKLVLVDLSSKSHMLSLVKRKASEKGLDGDRFSTFAGDITKLRSSGGPPCNVITNAANWRLKPGGGGVNAAIYKAAGPEFEQATKKVASTVQPGTSIVVQVPESSVLRNQEGVTHVIHVLGPNMNPQRPNCLSNDYIEGCKILRNAYSSLFENFATVAQVKPVVADSGLRKVGTRNFNTGPKLNAFQVLMQASKRKGEMGDTASKREKGEKVRVVEDGVACLRGEHAEGGQPSLPSDAGSHQGSTLAEIQGNNSVGQQVRKKVDRKWDHWSLALYKIALHPDDAPSKNSLLEVTDSAVVMEDLYPKAKRHLLVVSRTQELDTVEDVRREHAGLLEHMHSLGMKYVASFLKDDPLLVFRLGYHSNPSMRQLHLHVVSQDFDSASLKNKKHWNSFTSPFFRDSLDVINEVKTHGYVDNCGPSAEKLLDLELRCHRCRSVQPNIPRLKTHISTCSRPLSNSNHLITVSSVDGS
ncbi:hypothetical protein R1flu_014885 [Riccia fluitans]|uniref:Macro domain-containing protein n=1 Tax=Riccia fluitans TaxID=41844 RepID=A0ABD1YHC8_9MARC